VNSKFTFSKMTEPDAIAILSWRYEAPYDFYDPAGPELKKDVATLVEPTNLYLALRDGNEELIGYYCFGEEAQVADGDYPKNALDIGGNSRPDLLGTGLGVMFVHVATDFGKMVFKAEKFRTTVAAFNTRALHMCERAGFIRERQFTRDDGTEFIVLVKDAEKE